MAMQSEDGSNERCVAAAIALSVAHILTLIGTEYQAYAAEGFRPDRFHDFFFVNYGTFLSPLVLLFAFRRVCIALGILAVPILIFFTLRMHHVWQFYCFGVNSMAVQKGDGLGFLNMVFDMLSVALAVPFLLFILFKSLIEGLERIWRG